MTEHPDAADRPSAFQRRPAAGPRDAELRGMVPVELLSMIDALMQAQGLQSRMDVVIPVLQRHVDSEIGRATLLLRMARINPLLTEPDGRGPE